MNLFYAIYDIIKSIYTVTWSLVGICQIKLYTIQPTFKRVSASVNFYADHLHQRIKF